MKRCCPQQSRLSNKKILIGITGSIAAYKAAMLVRLLVSEGAQVRVLMSEAAKDFITPLTMATLSRNPVFIEGFDPSNGSWNSHISLGEWADYYLIAPATANTIAKMRGGIADNLLLCTYLSVRCPVAIAPAMDLDMYAHSTTQQNIEYLRGIGVRVIEPEAGFLASGLVGKGRMSEPEQIVEFVVDALSANRLLDGKKVLITAGATVEQIDPVRFISNHSTGKMGYALADAFAEVGAQVVLVSGAASAKLRCEGVEKISVLSAEQMYDAVSQRFDEADITLFCAAVADYTPSEMAENKIKHEGHEELVLKLRATKDIAAHMGARKQPGQLTVCFALETENELENARRKMCKKNADFVVLNSLRDSGAGFGTDTNKVTVISRELEEQLPLMSKDEVAARIVELVAREAVSRSL